MAGIASGQEPNGHNRRLPLAFVPDTCRLDLAELPRIGVASLKPAQMASFHSTWDPFFITLSEEEVEIRYPVSPIVSKEGSKERIASIVVHLKRVGVVGEIADR